MACLCQSWIIFSSQDKTFIIFESFRNFPPQLKTLNFGTETISHRGPQLWNLIPDNIKSEPTLELFRKKIRKWKCEPCPCRMCKTYLQHTGFQVIKILASMVRTGLFYHALKHCVRGWESILISYLYYVLFNRL